MYRTLGKTGEKVSTIGFGCMRFEVLEDDNSKIDEPVAIKLVRDAIDMGVNYLDTAYPYHGGNSERVVAKIMKDGYREKVHIATKLPSWAIEKPEDMDRYLNEQLEKLEIDQIDFYLIHALDKERWANLTKLGLLEWMDKIQSDGRVKHVGFSFHDDLETFKKIVDGYDWAFTQIQLNIIDEHHQQGIEGMYYARERGLGIIIMEPLRGGALADAKSIPQEILDIYGDVSPVEWAMKYMMNFEEVDLILSGMNSIDQVIQNVEISKRAEAGSMSEAELLVIDKAQKIYNDRILVNCTKCQYCMPCPHGVDIPENFRVYNESNMLDLERSQFSYANFFDEAKKAHNCIECGICEPMCPQHISIIEELKNVTKTLSK